MLGTERAEEGRGAEGYWKTEVCRAGMWLVQNSRKSSTPLLSLFFFLKTTKVREEEGISWRWGWGWRKVCTRYVRCFVDYFRHCFLPATLREKEWGLWSASVVG